MVEMDNIFDIVYYTNVQNNSSNGKALFKKKKIFFKIVDESSFIKELNGYLVSINKIPVKKLIYTSSYKNQFILVFEYDDSIKTNAGLLNDYLVKYDLSNIKTRKNQFTESLFQLYQKQYSDISYQKEYCNKVFFHERIDSRLKNWYSNENIFSKKVIFNKINSKTTNEIINETVRYFSNNDGKKESCIFSQGDPNTMNISLEPVLFDLMTAGNNCIKGELAITIISTLLYDNYFCPKYHKKSYFKHEKALSQLKSFVPKISFKENDKTIKIDTNVLTSYVRKEYILEYLKILKEARVPNLSNMKYYFIMRLLTVFDIRTMEKKDYFYSVFLVHYFYKNITDDFYSSIVKLINGMDTVVLGEGGETL